MTEDWADFASRLERVLSEWGAGESLVIVIIADRTEPACFVQYACNEGGVWAEVAANDVRPPHRQLSQADGQALRAAGWGKPSRGRGHMSVRNWWAAAGPERRSRPKSQSRIVGILWRVFSGPPGPNYQDLAGMTVLALRDVMGIDTPRWLTYRAFVHASGEPLSVDSLGLRPAGPGPDH